MIDPGLKDKVVLVTGGNNPLGIGAVIARIMASYGARVFIHYFRYRGDLPAEPEYVDQASVPGLALFFAQNG